MRNPFRREAAPAERDAPTLSFNDYLGILNQFSFNGSNYSLNGSPQEEINGNFVSMARGAYKSDSVVFACMLARRSLFRQARFQWQRVNNGRLGDMFGTQDLSPLETPWPGGTTAGLLGRAIDMVDLGGNFYATANRATGGINWLRPDWTTIVAGNVNSNASMWDPDTEVVGYRYQPGGPGSGEDPIFYTADQVAHWAPIPDPESRFLGMSWLTPVIREVMADKAMTEHKLKFMENAATPNLVVKLNVSNLESFTKWMQQFREDHEGAENAYRTVFLGAGADVSVVGSSLEQIDFKVVQGAGETRVAAAAGVPPIIVGLSEGLQAATYSNYGQARRRFADGTMWDLWNDFCGAISPILTVPGGAQLAVDGTSIPFLREDEADVATIQFTNAQAIKQLTDAGYTAESVVQAITANDLTKLDHTGLFSVQLLPPGSKQTPADGGAPPTQPAKPAPTPPQRDDGSRGAAQLAIPNVSVNFNERAFVNETAAPEVRVEFADGAFRMEPSKVDVNIEAPPPAETRVEINERAFVVDAPPPAEVNVTVEAPPPAETRVEIAEGAFRVDAPPPAEINVTVEPAEAPKIDVHVDQPEVNVTVERSGKKRVDLGDGRSATVTEGDAKVIEFDDGRQVTVTEVDE